MLLNISKSWIVCFFFKFMRLSIQLILRSYIIILNRLIIHKSYLRYLLGRCGRSLWGFAMRQQFLNSFINNGCDLYFLILLEIFWIYLSLTDFIFICRCCIKIITNDMLKKIVLLTLPWIAFAYGTFPSEVVEIHHIKMIVSNVVLSTHFVIQSRPPFKKHNH